MSENGTLRLILRALQSRNYRLFFAGQSISLIGTWMQQVAMSWLVYRITGSAFLLGVVGFASQVPTFLLAPVAGVLADRMDRRRLLIATQSLALVQALLLALLVGSGDIRVWHIVALSVVLGLVNGFDIPARQSFVIDLVERKEDLPNAIALNSSMVNGARLIGPSLAGLLIGPLGETGCFAVNAASYCGVIAALGAMRVTPMRRASSRTVFHDLLDGLRYVSRCHPIRDILLLLSLVSLGGMPYAVLMPIFAKDVLHGGAHTFGFLMTAAGAGALVSTVYLASRRTVLGLGRVIAGACAVFGASVALFALSSSLLLSVAVLVPAGFGSMAQIASSNTVLQTIVDDDKRGRVMSFFTMAFMGMAPFGSLLAGSVSSGIGPRWTLLAGGMLCVAGGVAFALRLPRLREMVRPVYVRKGILPVVAAGIGSASELTVPPEEQ